MYDIPDKVKGGIHKNIFSEKTWQVLDLGKPVDHIKEEKVLKDKKELKSPAGVLGRKYRKNDIPKIANDFASIYHKRLNGEDLPKQIKFDFDRKLITRSDKTNTPIVAETEYVYLYRFLLQCTSFKKTDSHKNHIPHRRSPSTKTDVDLGLFRDTLKIANNISSTKTTHITKDNRYLKITVTDTAHHKKEFVHFYIPYSTKYPSR